MDMVVAGLEVLGVGAAAGLAVAVQEAAVQGAVGRAVVAKRVRGSEWFQKS